MAAPNHIDNTLNAVIGWWLTNRAADQHLGTVSPGGTAVSYGEQMSIGTSHTELNVEIVYYQFQLIYAGKVTEDSNEDWVLGDYFMDFWYRLDTSLAIGNREDTWIGTAFSAAQHQHNILSTVLDREWWRAFAEIEDVDGEPELTVPTEWVGQYIHMATRTPIRMT